MFKLGLTLGMGVGYLAGKGKLRELSAKLQQRWDKPRMQTGAGPVAPTPAPNNRVVVGPGMAAASPVA